MKKTIHTFIFIFCALIAIAQAPQKFNYQAVARNAQGSILPNQNVKIKASILTGSANGSSQYSETHNATTNQLGLFNLAIGGGTVVSGNFANVTWASGDKYLKIEMDATGGNNFTLVGTSQLLSVPYALNAGNGSQWEKLNNSDTLGIHSDTTLSYRVNIGTKNLGPFPQRLGIKGVTVTYDQDPPIGYNGYTSLLGFYSKNNALVWNYALNLNDDLLFTATTVSDGVLTLGRNGNVGISKGGFQPAGFTPKSRLHIQSGDIYLEDATKGVIMKSPNGQCWRMTVSNAGQPVFTSVACPQ